jgi:hypothetical protein
MLALQVPWASLVQSFLEILLRVEGFLSLGGLFPCFWLVLPSYTQVVEGDMIVGGAIGLHLVALLLPGDDDMAGIPAGVDDSAEVNTRYEILSFQDAYSGYHQIMMKESNQLASSFITPFGMYYYVTMPFGLKIAGATNQRCMQRCFTD